MSLLGTLRRVYRYVRGTLLKACPETPVLVDIYSQVISCSASEVAAMIEGLLRHLTTAEIERNYTDTHGASVVGSAFAHLLGFQLLPRLKNIGSARLYVPAAGQGQAWPQPASVLSARPVDRRHPAAHRTT